MNGVTGPARKLYVVTMAKVFVSTVPLCERGPAEQETDPLLFSLRVVLAASIATLDQRIVGSLLRHRRSRQ